MEGIQELGVGRYIGWDMAYLETYNVKDTYIVNSLPNNENIMKRWLKKEALRNLGGRKVVFSYDKHTHTSSCERRGVRYPSCT